MFKKLGGGLKTLGKGKKEKLRVDLEVIDISGLPPPIRECRVMWITQKGMVQLTPSKVVRAGTARFRGQTMTHITSMSRNKAGECQMKEFVIKVQAPSAGDRIATFCKAPLDLSKYVSNTPEPSTQSDVIPLLFKVGAPTTGYLKFNVTCTHLGEVAEDGMTDMTGLTSEADQDLDGFEMPPSPTSSMRSVRTSTSGREPSIHAKHEKKGSIQSKIMSRIHSMGKDSFSSSKLAREEHRASTDGGSGAGQSTRASDSGSGFTEPSKPAPDFGKKTGSASSQSGRPPEYKPPTPSDFSKKTGATSSSSAAGAYGIGGLGKPPRPSADPYAEDYDAPKPLPIERPKTQTRKGLMGFMQERDEDDNEEEPPAPAPTPPTSNTQPPDSNNSNTNATNTSNTNPFRPSTPTRPPSMKPEIANPFGFKAAHAASSVTPDHVSPPASTSASAAAPGGTKPGVAPLSQLSSSAAASNAAAAPRASSSTAASDAAAAGPSSHTATSNAAAAAKASSSVAASDAAAAAPRPSASLSPGVRAAAGSTAGPAAPMGSLAVNERQAPERSSNKPAAPLAWRGSKAEAKIPLPLLNTAPFPPPPTPPAPPLAQSTLSDRNGAAPSAAAPPSPTAVSSTATELEAGASGSVPSPTSTAREAAAGRAASATPSAAPSEAVETGTPAGTDHGLSRATSLSQPASAAPPVPPATVAAAATAAMATPGAPSSPVRLRAGLTPDPVSAMRRENSVGRPKLESESSMLTTIVRQDSVQSSLYSSGADEEAVEGGATPSMPGIKTTERRRMQSLESLAEADLPESQQLEREAEAEENEEEGEEHRHKQHMKQKGWPPAGVAEEGQLSSSDGRQGSVNSPWVTASSGGVVSPSWGHAEQDAAVHASENGGDDRSQALQAMCARLEQQAEAERLAGAKARQQLVAAQREIESLKAQQAVQRQQPPPPQPTEMQGEVGELHRRVQEAEMIAAGVKRSNEAITQELESTKRACSRLENLVCEGLNGWNHDQALEAVSCFQDKYEQLQVRYQQMEADFIEEADSLVAQLLDVMQQVDELSACLPEGTAGYDAARNKDRPRTQYIEAPHAHTLRMENEALVQQLVTRQLELAGAMEEKAKLRRDLYRTKEVNLKVANKLTNLQSQVYAYESGYVPQ